MLILERNPGETLKITTPDGTVILVTLTEIKGGKKAFIGIDAPADYRISRTEGTQR